MLYAHIHSQVPQDSTTCTKHLFHSVATALWQGNSTLWMHRLPTLPPPQWTVYCSVCVCVCVCVCVDFVPKKKVFGAQHELEFAEKHQQGSSQAYL